MKKLILVAIFTLTGCVVPPYQSYTPSAPAPSMFDSPQKNVNSNRYAQSDELQHYDNRVRVDVYHHQVEPQRPTTYPIMDNEPSWQPSFGTLGSGLGTF